MTYSLFEAARDLPLRLVKWSEDLTPEGLDILVTCDGGLALLHVRAMISAEDLAACSDAIGLERLVGLRRRHLVETFRNAHPEQLPVGHVER